MFLGTYELKFSGQGRVILPKKIRKEINNIGLILSKGFEGCIWGFGIEEFEKEAKKQLEISVTEENARFLQRFLFSGSEPVELDAQGRFVIPSTLLDFARVGEKVVIIGAGDHFEIWDKKMWEEHSLELGRRYGRLP
jgi:MraZ protein